MKNKYITYIFIFMFSVACLSFDFKELKATEQKAIVQENISVSWDDKGYLQLTGTSFENTYEADTASSTGHRIILTNIDTGEQYFWTHKTANYNSVFNNYSNFSFNIDLDVLSEGSYKVEIRTYVDSNNDNQIDVNEDDYYTKPCYFTNTVIDQQSTISYRGFQYEITSDEQDKLVIIKQKDNLEIYNEVETLDFNENGDLIVSGTSIVEGYTTHEADDAAFRLILTNVNTNQQYYWTDKSPTTSLNNDVFDDGLSYKYNHFEYKIDLSAIPAGEYKLQLRTFCDSNKDGEIDLNNDAYYTRDISYNTQENTQNFKGKKYELTSDGKQTKLMISPISVTSSAEIESISWEDNNLKISGFSGVNTYPTNSPNDIAYRLVFQDTSTKKEYFYSQSKGYAGDYSGALNDNWEHGYNSFEYTIPIGNIPLGKYNVYVRTFVDTNGDGVANFDDNYYTIPLKATDDDLNDLIDKHVYGKEYEFFIDPSNNLKLNVNETNSKNISTNLNSVTLSGSASKVIAIHLDINNVSIDGSTKSCVDLGSPPKVYLDKDGDFNTTNDRVYPVAYSRNVNDCNEWFFDFNPSQLEKNKNYKIMVELPEKSENTAPHQKEVVYYTGDDVSSSRGNTEILTTFNNDNRGSITYSTNANGVAIAEDFQYYGESLDLYVNGTVNGQPINAIRLVDVSNGDYYTYTNSSGDYDGRYDCPTLVTGYDYSPDCLDRGVVTYNLPPGTYEVKALNTSSGSITVPVYSSISKLTSDSDNVNYTLPRDNARKKITLTTNANNVLTVKVEKIGVNQIPANYYDVVVDPGHGDPDNDASQGPCGYEQDVKGWGTMSCEKDYNLVFAGYLTTQLENQGLKVYEVRTPSSEEVSNYNYGKKGVKHYDKYSRIGSPYETSANYYISVHHNGGSTTSTGYQVYSPVATSTQYADAVATQFSYIDDAQGYNGTDKKGNKGGTYKRTYGAGGPCGSSSSMYNSMDYYFFLRETGGDATTCKAQTGENSYDDNAYNTDRNASNSILLELTFIQNPTTMHQFYSEGVYKQYVNGFVEAFAYTWKLDYHATRENYVQVDNVDNTNIEGVFYTNTEEK